MRSKEVTLLVKRFINDGNFIVIDDGEVETTCHKVNEALKLIDNLDECNIRVIRRIDNFKLGWVFCVLSNDAGEQLADWSVTDYMDKAIEQESARAEKIRKREGI